MEFLLDSIASYQLASSLASIASLYVVGSPASVNNKPGEYLFGSCDNLFDQRGMTGLAGSGAAILHTSKLGSAEWLDL
jgi:hypothetical protein